MFSGSRKIPTRGSTVQWETRQASFPTGTTGPQVVIFLSPLNTNDGFYLSHPRGQNFNQGRDLPSSWLNSDPEGEISLSYMDRLMMVCFFPTFPRYFVGTKKCPKILKKLNFLLVGITLFLSSRVFLSGIKRGVNIVCTSLLTQNTIGALVELGNAN